MKFDPTYAAVVGAGGAGLTALLRSARFSVHDRQIYDAWWGARRAVVFALWHGRLLPCSFFHRQEGLATLVSRHRDGDYIAGVVERWWGFDAIRGSSSRGASSALRQIVRTLRGGVAVAITPDGPRGPRQTMKTGPLHAAQMAGVPVVPVAAGADRAWWLGGWDRFMVPKPFARIVLAYGEPLAIPRDASTEDVGRLALELEERLNTLTERVDALARG